MDDIDRGTVLAGRFRLEDRLGEGGMGIVWAALEIATEERVAIKVLRRDAAGREDARRRLLREARAIRSLGHPHIIALREVIELADGAPAIVMERLHGEPLSERLQRDGCLAPGEVARLFVPVVSAVGTAHALGVVHRDLKPQNIFLARGPDGAIVVKVLDFGAALLPGGGDPSAWTGSLTATGTLVGTPCYMSPEQASGETDIDHRTDLWALGLLLYRALAGFLPTAGENLGQVFKAILSRPIWPLAEAAPDTPPDVAAMVDRMLSRPRGKRPADLREVLEILARHTGVTAPAFGPATVPLGEDTAPVSGGAERASAPIRGDPPSSPRGEEDTSTSPAAREQAAPAPAHRPRTRGALAAIAALAIAGSVAAFVARPRATPTAAGPNAGSSASAGTASGGSSARPASAGATPRLRRITTDGEVGAAAFSPDGHALAIQRGGVLRVQHDDGAPDEVLEITHDDWECAHPRWLPDGRSIWYDAAEPTVSLDGKPGRAFGDLVSFSRDGARRAQWRTTRDIRIFDSAAEIERRVKMPEGASFLNYVEPAPRDPRALLLTRGNTFALWLLGEDDSQRELARGGQILAARWSPRGDSVVALHAESGHTLDLVSLPVGGGAARVLVPAVTPLPTNDCASLSIAPDGRVALVREQKHAQIILLERAGEGWRARPVTADGADREGLSVSPDGRKIAYVEHGNGRAGYLHVHDLASGKGNSIADYEGNGKTATAWSPDGQHLAFVEIRPDGVHRIRVMKVDQETSDVRTVPAGRLSHGDPSIEWLDARTIVYEGIGNTAILAMDITTGESRALFAPDNGWVMAGQLAPDRRELSFYWNPKRREADVVPSAYVLRIADGHVRRLRDTLGTFPMAWEGDGHVLVRRHLSGLEGGAEARAHTLFVSDGDALRPFGALPVEGSLLGLVPVPKGHVALVEQSSRDLWIVEGIEPLLGL